MGQCDKKYELTDETMLWNGRTLHRIRALKDFGDVEAGEFGGWIEREENLSQEGLAWVADEAKAYDSAQVCDNALLYDYAQVYGNTLLYDYAQAYGDAQVYGDARMNGNVQVRKNAHVYGDARICGNVLVYGDSQVYGNTELDGNAKINGCADIKNNDCLLSIDGIGSRYDTTTFFTGSDGKIHVVCGCFSGTLDKFAAKVQETHGENQYGLEYCAAIQLAKLHILHTAE